MPGMDARRLLRPTKALLALAVVALTGGELLGGHAEPLSRPSAGVHSHAVEAAAAHAGAAAHFDAAGERQTLHCPFCTLRAHGARLLPPAPSALGPAPAGPVVERAAERLPGGRDARGAARGRAPPVA